MDNLILLEGKTGQAPGRRMTLSGEKRGGFSSCETRYRRRLEQAAVAIAGGGGRARARCSSAMAVG